MAVTRLSRYEYASIHRDENGNLFIDAPDPIPRKISYDDRRYITSETDTLFSMAWLEYTDMLDYEQDIRPSGFWWVIAEANDLIGLDQVLQIQSAQVLRVPSQKTLMTEIVRPPRVRHNRSIVR